MKVVLASANPGKLRELAALLGPLGWELAAQSAFGIEPAEETGDTFAANALLKARHAAAGAGRPALADDSGLEVDALGGRPGVRSARYAGPECDDAANNRRLLEELAGVPDAERTARYRCVIAFARAADDPAPVLAEGRWEGRILRAPRGANGFGYDPLFHVPTHSCASAELEPAVKNGLSHRGAALRALLAAVRSEA